MFGGSTVERSVVPRRRGEALKVGGEEPGFEARIAVKIGGEEVVVDDEPAAGPEHAAGLRQEGVSLEPVEAGGDGEEVDGVVGQGKRLGRTAQVVNAFVVIRLSKHGGGSVCTDDASRDLLQGDAGQSGPTGDVEDIIETVVVCQFRRDSLDDKVVVVGPSSGVELG